ncbi:MAG: hypothetical protein KF842_11015 [Caulobacter sp.]|nr:hypothetical protein [Caulobacter sp.]
MRFPILLTAAVSVAALSAGSAAFAHAGPPVDQPPSAAPVDATTAPQTVPEGTMKDDSMAQPVILPADSPTPVDQAYLLKAGDPTVTSNTPVPDTPAVRAEFGGPDSHGGQQTKPVGN